MLLTACNETPTWTLHEANEWHKKYSNAQMIGSTFYQGSDKSFHYFISRSMDSWIDYKINKKELELKYEEPKEEHISSRLGHFLVDPLNDFQKVNENAL